MAVGLVRLRSGGAGIGSDACATTAGNHRLGQVEPPACLCCDDLVGLQSFSTPVGVCDAWTSGLRGVDRNSPVIHTKPIC